MTGRLLTWALIGVFFIAVIAAAIYAFGMRSGRYQATYQGRTLVVVDTATGLFWVYEPRGPREELSLVQTEPPVGFLLRLLPPQWLDHDVLIGEGQPVPGSGWRTYPPSSVRRATYR